MNDLRADYRSAAQKVPLLGNVDLVLESAARRRRRARVAAPLAVVCCVLVGAAVAQARWDVIGQPPRVAATPPAETTISPGEAVSWPPAPIVRGGVREAPVGTLMYSTCPQPGACVVTLVSPDGSTTDLASAWPAMASRLRSQGLAGATLSYDALWLGVPTDHGYAVYGIRAGNPYRARGIGGNPWQVVGWTLGSGSLALAHQESPEVRFAVIEPGVSAGWHLLSTDTQHVPVGNGADSIQVVQPADVLPPGARVTTLDIENLIGSRLSGYPVGSVQRYRSTPLDLSSCMHSDETLIGPGRVPVLATPPPGDTVDPYDESNAVVVFRDSGSGPTPSAIVRMTCEQEPGSSRYDLPRSSGSTTWRLLSPITTGDSLMTRSAEAGSQLDVVLVGLGHQTRLVQRLPADAAVLVPGGTVAP